MKYTTLGRTGLKVSVFGLGGGGHSRLGKSQDKTEVESIAIVQQALDAGVNFIDTAEGYGTEEIVGKGIAAVKRDSVVLSTKKSTDGITPDAVRSSLDDSLKRLGTDYVDIYHLHGVAPDDYERLLNDIIPTFEQLRQQGKIRFIGITERFGSDTQHAMLQRAVQDKVWDVMMVGFNILNQSARERVFPSTIQQNIGILVMFAVRRALSDAQRMRETLDQLVSSGQIDPADLDKDEPLKFLHADSHDLTDAAYRFCIYEPGAHVILSGTGSPEHLRENIESFTRPPLSPSSIQRLKYIFRRVDSISGQ